MLKYETQQADGILESVVRRAVKGVGMRQVLAVVAMGLMAVLFTTGAVAQPVVDESFDSYPPGSPPAAPWWNWGTDGVTLVDDTMFHGPSGCSVVLSRSVFPGTDFAFGRHFPALAGQLVIQYSFRITGNPREMLSVFALDDTNAIGPWVTVGYPFGGVWVFSESLDWLLVSVQLVPDAWYRVRLDIDVAANTYDIFVWNENDPSMAGSLIGVPFRTSAGVGPLTNIQFGDFNISTFADSHVAWVDDVLVLPIIFGDSFESGDLTAWSSTVP